MSVVDALVKLLSCGMVNGRSQSHVRLTEEDPSAKLRSLTLENLQQGMLVMHIDRGRKILHRGKVVAVCMSPLFKATGASDHNCSCDAVLLHEKANGECEIFYIDLTSKYHSP